MIRFVMGFALLGLCLSMVWVFLKGRAGEITPYLIVIGLLLFIMLVIWPIF